MEVLKFNQKSDSAEMEHMLCAGQDNRIGPMIYKGTVNFVAKHRKRRTFESQDLGIKLVYRSSSEAVKL